MKVLITGAAGFIGAAVALRLLERGDEVVGIDNLNDYYDRSLKIARLERLESQQRFTFHKTDISHRASIEELFRAGKPDAVAHFAAQAGVRYSIDNPHAYLESNLLGFGNVLEAARMVDVAHFVFASTSSVYGANRKMPFSEHDRTDHPVSLYGATKKANEVMAHSYAFLYRLPCTGLRFFTVYGPWGRPDMALFKFTQLMLAGRPIPVFNEGRMVRDFTYIDDIVEGVIRIIGRPAQPDAAWNGSAPDTPTSSAPYRIYNIGNNRPVELGRYIAVLEQCLGCKATLDLLPMQPGDVQATMADVGDLERAVGFSPETSIEIGIARFVEWYRSFYGTPDRNG